MNSRNEAKSVADWRSVPAKPKFSVIIPAYQAADTVGRAVASALGQTVSPYEIIVCDDGSYDDLRGALAPFSCRVKLLRQDNRGLSAARNTASQVATGDWVVLLDADDEWLPTRLEKMAQLITARPELDIVTTDAFCRREGLPDTTWYEGKTFPPPNEQLLAIFDENFIFGGAAVRLSRLREVGWFTTGLPHDSEWEAWVKLIFSGSLAGRVNEPLAVYYVGDAPRLSDRRSANYRMRIVVMEEWFPRLPIGLSAHAAPLIRRERQRLAVAEGVEATRERDRVGCLRASVGRDMPRRMRARFFFAAAFPDFSRRRLAGG